MDPEFQIDEPPKGFSTPDVPCPKCGKPMRVRLRTVDQVKFWGCADYPQCLGGRNLSDGQALRVAAAAHAAELAAAAQAPVVAQPVAPVAKGKKLGTLAAKLRGLQEPAANVAVAVPVAMVGQEQLALERQRKRSYAPKGRDGGDLGWVGLVRPYED